MWSVGIGVLVGAVFSGGRLSIAYHQCRRRARRKGVKRLTPLLRAGRFHSIVNCYKETFLVPPNAAVRVIGKFTGLTGDDVFQRHHLEHEDFAMMAQFRVG